MKTYIQDSFNKFIDNTLSGDEELDKELLSILETCYFSGAMTAVKVVAENRGSPESVVNMMEEAGVKLMTQTTDMKARAEVNTQLNLVKKAMKDFRGSND